MDLKRKQRIKRGNILTISAIVGVVILVIALWVIDISWLHFLNAKEMSAAEKVAMAAAVALNRDDNIGQMNYMLAHCREHILCVRFNETEAAEHLDKEECVKLKKLAEALAHKAHDVANVLSEERNKLEKLRIKQALEAAQKAVSSAGSPGAAQMASIATSGTSLYEEQCYLGCVKKTSSAAGSDENLCPSNVEPTKYHFNELETEKADQVLADYDKKFIDESANLYKGNLSSPLDLNFPGGGDDQDLQFLLSSVPPCINGYVSPPRLIQTAEFHQMAPLKAGSLPRYIPSAVYIVLKLDVKDTQSGGTSRLMAPGAAVTNGASPPP